MVEVERPHMTK